MTDILVWPQKLLIPTVWSVEPVPMSRGGGRTLGGLDRAVMTDLGYWAITLSSIPIRGVAQRRAWDAIRTALSGRAGLIAVPAQTVRTAPWPSSARDSVKVTHSDGSTFSDGTSYLSSTIVVTAPDGADIGDTSIRLQSINSSGDLSGVRFSYQHALYETGRILASDDTSVTVSLFPSVRAAIPAGAGLEFDRPMCLVHLATDDAMNIDGSRMQPSSPSVAFIEATDYWTDLALGLAS